MTLAAEVEALSSWIDRFPERAKSILGEEGSPIYTLDFIVIGAIKRSLSLAAGLLVLIRARNIVCARAVLRMHMDTITRLSAYTYVDNPEQMARAILGGTALKTFKSRDGERLTDGYLVDRLSERRPWVRRVYEFTSGYVHFSERQFFDSVRSLGGAADRTMQLEIGRKDRKYPESSWEELPACFRELNGILEELLTAYVTRKHGA
jgi:hypothetical protein